MELHSSKTHHNKIKKEENSDLMIMEEQIHGILKLQEEAECTVTHQWEEEKEVEMGSGKIGFWDETDFNIQKRFDLKLNLNYQQVLEAWSDRSPLWTAHHEQFYPLPVRMEEERGRREASVIRYKEKRQNRLFSKKIRYQVRKLNAEKRPRFKGRFVRRTL